MKGIAEVTANSLAKTLGLRLQTTNGLIAVIDQDRTVFSYGNWVELSAFLLGVAYGEGRGTGKAIRFGDWMAQMKDKEGI